MNIFEMYGRQAEQYQESIDAFRRSLQLLRELKAGNVTLAAVKVNDTSWELVEVNDAAD